MAESDSQSFAGFLLTPVGGFAIAAGAWFALAAPCTYSAGGVAVHGQCVGSQHDPKAFITMITGICTVVGWAILGVIWIMNFGNDTGAAGE